MDIAFYGSSLLSSYWNGAATYYRGLLQALAALGHDVTFFEPDAFDRQAHRDIEPPEWAHVVVYAATPEAMRAAAAQAAAADLVVKASGVGVFDDELLEAVMDAARPARSASSGTWTPPRPSPPWPPSRAARCAAGSPRSTWC